LSQPSRADLQNKADLFAREVDATLHGVLPGAWRVVAAPDKNNRRYVIQPGDKDDLLERIPLLVDGEQLAELSVQFYTVLDTTGEFLKTVRSSFAIYSLLEQRQALVRQEFDESRTSTPAAHWHFHAERGAFTHLLTLAQAHNPRPRERPHMLQSLHFPVGGNRFRPCLEDFLEFLVMECGVDAVEDTWREAVLAGRERWRRRQLRTVVRDIQSEAADTLQSLGWTVTPPEGWKGDERGWTLLKRW
jgi:hypothetical protein